MGPLSPLLILPDPSIVKRKRQLNAEKSDQMSDRVRVKFKKGTIKAKHDSTPSIGRDGYKQRLRISQASQVWTPWSLDLETTNSCNAHSSAITSLTFSPDGLYLLSTANNETVIKWDITDFTNMVSFNCLSF